VNNSREIFIPANDVKSLSWEGDHLVDWASCGDRYELDGTKHDAGCYLAYTFDAAAVSPSRRYAVVYERLGTKALLLDRGKVLRELNRSYYHAKVYEYPITLFRLPDGREVIAHCPEKFSRLDIDDLASGKRLTDRRTTDASAPFHSRIAASASGTKLMSAGWIWQPNDVITVFDVEQVLSDPTVLDEHFLELYSTCSEVSSAALQSDRFLILWSSKDAEDFGWDHPEPKLVPGGIAVYDLQDNAFVSAAMAEEEVGTMMPVGSDHVVGFYDHPKLIELVSGKVVQRWPNIKSGSQNSSIIWGKELSPPIALDAANRRFAVAGDDGISVVLL
jgi:hypothetical protein